MADGLRLGVTLIISGLVCNAAFSPDSLVIVNLYTWTIAIASVFCLIKCALLFRREELSNQMTYLEALIYLCWTIFFASLIFTIAVYSYLRFHSGFVSDFFTRFIAEMSKIPEYATILPVYKEAQEMYVSMSDISVSFMAAYIYMMAGVIFSLIASIFLRKS